MSLVVLLLADGQSVVIWALAGQLESPERKQILFILRDDNFLNRILVSILIEVCMND